jgi:hypothetical protein
MWRFCRGFCKNAGAERGVLHGRTWWDCGESAVENGSKKLAENTQVSFTFF